jgi:hypothetical protein
MCRTVGATLKGDDGRNVSSGLCVWLFGACPPPLPSLPPHTLSLPHRPWTSGLCEKVVKGCGGSERVAISPGSVEQESFCPGAHERQHTHGSGQRPLLVGPNASTFATTRQPTTEKIDFIINLEIEWLGFRCGRHLQSTSTTSKYVPVICQCDGMQQCPPQITCSIHRYRPF